MAKKVEKKCARIPAFDGEIRRTFDRAKCQQRNRIAAKDGFNAHPMRLMSDLPESFSATGSDTVVIGSMPSSTDEALGLINALLSGGSGAVEPLGKGDVWIHYAEAANGNFIPDRYAFLDASTLKNIATDAGGGFAFMNSHRTGGMSHPAELPFGKTFCGAYKEWTDADGNRQMKAYVGLYMLRGVRPNGKDGPSTDDLHKMIDGGQLADVSVGLYGGMAVCDVCGEDLSALDDDGDYVCPHMPGTDYQVTAKQSKAQKAKGVPDGYASYTLVDCHCGEVSGVYDGAVPGAGFKKAITLARSRALAPDTIKQARHAYAALLSQGDLEMDEDKIINAIGKGFAKAFRKFGFSKGPAGDVEEPKPVKTETSSEVTEKLARLEAEAAASKVLLGQQNDLIKSLNEGQVKFQRDAQIRENLARVEAAVKSFKILPSVRGKFEDLAKGENNGVVLDASAAQTFFGLTMDGIEANGAVVALAGDGAGTHIGNDGSSSTLAAQSTTEGDEMTRLANEMHKAHPERSLVDCFLQVGRERKDLASGHRTAVIER